MDADLSRRSLVAAVPTMGLAAILSGCAARTHAPVRPGDVYRLADEAAIIAAARAIIAEDWVATLITMDENGMPRARSVGVSDPDPDLTLWISTRRTSRKLDQIRRHPAATLHFAKDDLGNNFRTAYYASFMGEASVHIDDDLMRAHTPDAATLRGYWPNFPNDYAVIRFRPRWVEVYGHGIAGKPENWQPQGAILAS